MTLHPADPSDRIIVALDGMAPEQALAFATQVEGLRWVKVGLELFVQAGPEVVVQLPCERQAVTASSRPGAGHGVGGARHPSCPAWSMEPGSIGCRSPVREGTAASSVAQASIRSP